MQSLFAAMCGIHRYVSTKCGLPFGLTEAGEGGLADNEYCQVGHHVYIDVHEQLLVVLFTSMHEVK